MKKKRVLKMFTNLGRHLHKQIVENRKRIAELERRVDKIDRTSVTVEDLIKVRQHMYFLDVEKTRAVGNAIDDYLNWTRKRRWADTWESSKGTGNR